MAVLIQKIQNEQMVSVGKIFLSPDGSVHGLPSDSRLVRNIIQKPVHDPQRGGKVTAEEDPQRFLQLLPSTYRNPYLMAVQEKSTNSVSRKSLLKPPVVGNFIKRLVQGQDKLGRRYCTDNGKRVPCPSREKPSSKHPSAEKVVSTAKRAVRRSDPDTLKKLAQSVRTATRDRRRGSLGKSGLQKIARELGLHMTAAMKKESMVKAVMRHLTNLHKLSPEKIKKKTRILKIRKKEKESGVKFQDRLLAGLLELTGKLTSRENQQAVQDVARNGLDAKDSMEVVRKLKDEIINELRSGQIQPAKIEVVLNGLSASGHGTVSTSELPEVVEDGIIPSDLSIQPAEPGELRRRDTSTPRKRKETQLDRLDRPLEERLKQIKHVYHGSKLTFPDEVINKLIMGGATHLFRTKDVDRYHDVVDAIKHTSDTYQRQEYEKELRGLRKSFIAELKLKLEAGGRTTTQTAIDIDNYGLTPLDEQGKGTLTVKEFYQEFLGGK